MLLRVEDGDGFRRKGMCLVKYKCRRLLPTTRRGRDRVSPSTGRDLVAYTLFLTSSLRRSAS